MNLPIMIRSDGTDHTPMYRVIKEGAMRSMILAFTAATALVSAGAQAADLYPEAPPPAAEGPPPAYAPPRVAVVPEAPIVVEPRCPVIWRCGYWGCGWRQACPPLAAEVYPYPRYYGPYPYYRSYWGHYHPHWGYRRHWSG
jgi:hypothetical protein